LEATHVAVLEIWMASKTTVRLLESRVDELTGRLRTIEGLLGDVSFHASEKLPAESPISARVRRYLTVDEAADYLGLSVSMMNRWRCDLPGGPAYIKIGKRVLYAREDLDFLVNERRHCPR
jgi:hypothetical protein